MTNSSVIAASPSKIKGILLTGAVAGTLDVSTAIIVYSFIMKKVTAIQILQGIASGLLGKSAYEGGLLTAGFGLLLHYFIAFSFTTLYFFVFPYIPFLRKQKIISGLLYGVFAWIVMNRIILPLSQIHMAPFKWSSALIGATILMFCIGLPIALLASRYHARKNESRNLFTD